MSQLYLQQFEYRGAMDREKLDAAWAIAIEAMARHGNWGNVASGVKHLHGYGTGSGGFALIEVDDPEAFGRYQVYHNNNYGHVATLTFTPLADLDAALAPAIAEAKAKL